MPAGTIVAGSVELYAEIDHTYVYDFDPFRLQSPQGTQVIVMDSFSPGTSTGQCNSNNVRATFKDGAPAQTCRTSTCASNADCSAVEALVRPVGSFSAFNGQQSGGTWQVCARKCVCVCVCV